MSMSIIINSDEAWITKSGIFECVVEETRELFKDNEQNCVNKIYEPLDDFQQYIYLSHVDEECFNLFYNYCMKATDNFPDSERGKIPDKEYLPVILGNWSILLRMM